MAALRDALGMTQRELATELQVTSGAIAHWETGQETIPGPVLQLIALYERDLAQAAPARESPWIDRTTDLSVLGGTLMAQAMFASAPPSSIRARVRDRIANGRRPRAASLTRAGSPSSSCGIRSPVSFTKSSGRSIPTNATTASKRSTINGCPKPSPAIHGFASPIGSIASLPRRSASAAAVLGGRAPTIRSRHGRANRRTRDRLNGDSPDQGGHRVDSSLATRVRNATLKRSMMPASRSPPSSSPAGT